VYGDRTDSVLLQESDALEPSSPYGVSKRDGERALRDSLRDSGTSWIILRPTGVYGGARSTTQEFLRQVLSRRIWVHFPPQVTVHPTPVDDLVHCILGSLARPVLSGQVINVAGERPLPYEAWIAATAAALGTRARQWVVPAGGVMQVSRAAVALSEQFHVAPPRRLMRARNRHVSLAVDIGKARELLDFRPCSLDAGLTSTVREARRLGAIPAVTRSP
jgi:nucleoside-diphosphate-sugar epimerase